jgi:hypothetical protein
VFLPGVVEGTPARLPVEPGFVVLRARRTPPPDARRSSRQAESRAAGFSYACARFRALSSSDGGAAAPRHRLTSVLCSDPEPRFGLIQALSP